ncbi:hypothetical protein SLS58_008958 [Diplodia intermedia]|uniref:Uncharacterized protein n=1 Tax=Diplodia intermedia TaxID=856260 RepID=A0ABR3TF05_9PEZI
MSKAPKDVGSAMCEINTRNTSSDVTTASSISLELKTLGSTKPEVVALGRGFRKGKDNSTPVTQGRISPVEEEEASSPTASGADTRDSDQHRQVALQTIDILRSNVDSFSMASTQSGEQTMIGVVQALLPPIQQTSQVSAQQIQHSAASCTVPGPVAQAQSNDTLSDIEKFLGSLPDMGNATFDPVLTEEDWIQPDPQNDLFNGNGFRSDLSWGL